MESVKARLRDVECTVSRSKVPLTEIAEGKNRENEGDWYLKM